MGGGSGWKEAGSRGTRGGVRACIHVCLHVYACRHVCMNCEYFLFPFIVADGVGMSILQKDDCGTLTSTSTVKIPGPTQQHLPLCATATTESWR